MKIFVTGGGGFLGHAIVLELLRSGHIVHTYSRNLYDSLELDGVFQFKGDLVDYNSVKEAMLGCNAVIHTASKIGFQMSYREFYKTNVLGTKNILKSCKELQIPYLVYTSSASVVYSEGSEGQNEDVPYASKFDAYYPKTKAIAEHIVLEASAPDLVTSSLRPHLIWGPGDPYLLPRLLQKRRKNKLWILGRRNYLTDVTYIENAAKAHLQVLKKMIDDPDSVAGKPYFISQDEPIAIHEFINRLLHCGGLEPVNKRINPTLARTAGWLFQTAYRFFRLKKEPPFNLFVAKQLSSSHWYDISAAKRDFEYFPEVSTDEGMKRLESFYREKIKLPIKP